MLVGFIGVALSLSLHAAPPLTSVAQPPTTPIATLEALRAELTTFVTTKRFNGAAWGIKVTSLDSGQTLFEYQPDARLSPASNSKLYVGALALEQLGGDYRIITPLLSSAQVTPDGELAGNLVIAGRGDPSWRARRHKPEFASAFTPFINALRAAGVRRIRGDLIADATWLRCLPHGASWTADDLNDYYGAEVSAITLAENYVDVRVRPGAAVGEPCAIEILEPWSGLVVDNRTRTSSAESLSTLRVQRLPGSTTVQFFGTLAVDAREEMTEATVPRPAEWFARALKSALADAGIVVEGRARSVVWPEAPTTEAIEIGAVASPTLRELVIDFMQVSQNLATNLVFAHLGELRREPATRAWQRSDELALDALDEFVRRLGITERDLIFEDGSGLSRNNLVTAASTVRLLEFMATHREAAAFAESLPLAGRSGSLRRRMKDTPAEDNLRAKTGTLRWAASVSGYVHSAAGERLVFSLMLNRHVAAPKRRAHDELDALAVMLARYAGIP